MQIENATLKIRSVSALYTPRNFLPAVLRKSLPAYSKQLKNKQVTAKVGKMNSTLQLSNMPWTAGKTPMCEKTYQAKKRLFGNNDVPNLQGFDCYLGGLFTLLIGKETAVGQRFAAHGGGRVRPTPTPTPIPTPPAIPRSDLIPYPTPNSQILAPAAWDWRNAHGQNWMSSVKNQGNCGSCWDFAAVGTLETNVNLYFNQHLNLDLSEQDILSCGGAGSCGGGMPDAALSFVRSTGIVDESCMPYRAIDASGCSYSSCGYTPVLCSSICSSPALRVSIAGTSSVSSTENDVKTAIVNSGAVAGIIWNWSHAMALVGYGVISVGDRIYASDSGGYNSYRIIAAGDPLIGRTYWTFKNSWGGGWGESGYCRVIFSSGAPPATKITTPITISGSSASIACVDNDADGYCNWGISATKPSTCPASCAAEKDCDDSNPAIGACNFRQDTAEYISICRTYLDGATFCPNSGQTCPAGYYALRSNQICASGRKGTAKQYWNYCVQDFNHCGICPAGSLLASYQYCSLGQICSPTSNSCL